MHYPDQKLAHTAHIGVDFVSAAVMCNYCTEAPSTSRVLGVRLCAIGRRDVLCLGILHFGGFWIAITSMNLMLLSMKLLVGRNPQQVRRGCVTSNNLEAVIASAATMAWLWVEKCCQWLVWMLQQSCWCLGMVSMVVEHKYSAAQMLLGEEEEEQMLVFEWPGLSSMHEFLFDCSSHGCCSTDHNQ